MKLEISWFKVLWKRIWGGKEAVFDYFLEKANSLVALIPEASKEKLQSIYEGLKKFVDLVEKLEWLVPGKWQNYFIAVMKCVHKIIDAIGDAKVSGDELKAIVAEFQSAYAVWRSEDEDEAEG